MLEFASWLEGKLPDINNEAPDSRGWFQPDSSSTLQSSSVRAAITGVDERSSIVPVDTEQGDVIDEDDINEDNVVDDSMDEDKMEEEKADKNKVVDNGMDEDKMEEEDRAENGMDEDMSDKDTSVKDGPDEEVSDKDGSDEDSSDEERMDEDKVDEGTDTVRTDEDRVDKDGSDEDGAESDDMDIHGSPKGGGVAAVAEEIIGAVNDRAASNDKDDDRDLREEIDDEDGKDMDSTDNIKRRDVEGFSDIDLNRGDGGAEDGMQAVGNVEEEEDALSSVTEEDEEQDDDVGVPGKAEEASEHEKDEKPPGKKPKRKQSNAWDHEAGLRKETAIDVDEFFVRSSLMP